MGNFLSKFHKDESGQGMTEYIIILVAIAVICIAISVQFGGKIKALFETADSEIDTVDSGLQNIYLLTPYLVYGDYTSMLVFTSIMYSPMCLSNRAPRR